MILVHNFHKMIALKMCPTGENVTRQGKMILIHNFHKRIALQMYPAGDKCQRLFDKDVISQAYIYITGAGCVKFWNIQLMGMMT